MQRGSSYQTPRSARGLALTVCVLGIAVFSVMPGFAATERVSLSSAGAEGNDHSTTSLYGVSSNAQGNVVAFTSFSDNLAPNDFNDASDVFVRDMTSGTTELISRSPISNNAGDGISYHPAISKDGRWVAFTSLADDLVPGDANGVADVFLRDRVSGTLTRLSESVGGSEGNGPSYFPSIATSRDGTKVFLSFTSKASNLPPGGSNGLPHIFHCTYDVGSGNHVIAQASVGVGVQSDGSLAFGQGDEASVLSTISADGRFIVYTSYIWNIIPPTEKKPDAPVLQILAYDHVRGSTIFRLITTPDEGRFLSVSADGRFFTYIQDAKVLAYDMLEYKTEVISIGTDGTEGNGASDEASISADGRFVAFTSAASNLVAGDFNGTEDVFVRDRAIRRTERVSLTFDGREPNGNSRAPSISDDGRTVVFSSSGTNIVPTDANNREDVFVSNWREFQPGSQPDMLIRNFDETWYAGNDLYNLNGIDQSATQVAEWSQPAVYHLKVQNDGSSPDTFIIAGSGGGAGWTVKYYDQLNGGVDISANVTGPGWRVGPLAPGNYVEFRVEIGLEPGVPPIAPHELRVTSSSASDTTNIDAVAALTTETSLSSQPDLLVRRLGDNWYIGNDVYNDTGANQTMTQIAAWDQGAVYELKVQNDGTVTDSFVIYGDPGGDGWTVSYFDARTGGDEITGQVNGFGYVTNPLPPGASVELRVEVTVDPGVPTDTPRQVLVSVQSATDDTKQDTIKTVTNPPEPAVPSQPDVLVRIQGDEWYVGNDVYNTTGASQTVSKNVERGSKVVYEVKIQNDGTGIDTFVAKANTVSNGWRVTFYDQLTGGANVTSLMVGNGFALSPLSPGGSTHLRVEVEAEPGIPVQGSRDVLLMVKSTTDQLKADTIRTITGPPQPRTFSHTFAPGIWLTAVPATPVDTDALAVFDTAMVAGWRAETQTYQFYVTGPLNVAIGDGYWVRYPGGYGLEVDGFASTGSVDRPLVTDWNLLGNPSTVPLRWDQIAATVRIQPFAWVQKADGSGYNLVSSLDLANGQKEIGGWQGFWLRSLEYGTIILGTSVVQEQQVGPDAVDWAIQLSARAGNATDDDNYIGVATASQPLVGANPPAMGSGYVDLYAVDTQGSRSAVNLVGSGQKTSWDLVAETDIPNTSVTISFPDLSAVPSDRAVVLTDLDASKSVNMRTSTGYTFVSGAGDARRHLRIDVAPRGGQAAITSAHASAAGRGLQVVYSLASPAEVEVEVMNIAGRRVALVSEGYQAAGAHTTTWSGVGLGGAKVPAGRYLVTVRGTADDGTQTARVLSAQVR